MDPTGFPTKHKWHGECDEQEKNRDSELVILAQL
jgi:hypothetical protein